MEKKHENFFKLVLLEGNNVICQRIFTGDNYNPVIRYSVDIRNKLNNFMKRVDKVLSKKNLTLNYLNYDTISFYKNLYSFSFYKDEKNKTRMPKSSSAEIGGRLFKGVKCKLGLYINDNPIVEREFFVYNYNPIARFSVDLQEEFSNIVNEIEENLRETDINRMWEDYEIIEKFGFNIQQIREMDEKERRKYLYRLNYFNKSKL